MAPARARRSPETRQSTQTSESNRGPAHGRAAGAGKGSQCRLGSGGSRVSPVKISADRRGLWAGFPSLPKNIQQFRVRQGSTGLGKVRVAAKRHRQTLNCPNCQRNGGRSSPCFETPAARCMPQARPGSVSVPSELRIPSDESRFMRPSPPRRRVAHPHTTQAMHARAIASSGATLRSKAPTPSPRRESGRCAP